jgi:Preprotein translocase subunit SecB
MDKQVKAAIKFIGYKVSKVIFEINENFGIQDDAVEMNYEFDINVAFDKEEQMAVVGLKCIINREYEKSNKPFFINLELQGLFYYDSNLEDSQLQGLLNTNAVAIVFPYLRSLISTITVNCGIPPVIIPTMNLVEVFKQSNVEG